MAIIPISKLLGNYNYATARPKPPKIIPISKLLGNYNQHGRHVVRRVIIPISKLLGNYNIMFEKWKINWRLYQYLNC